ncbi:MAG: hypothetical protein U1F76_24720 [Candidatus Competibacteraceae bacterium]
MLKKSLSTLTRAAFAAVVLAAAASTASATPVFTPNGDPFPTGSNIILGPGYDSPFGYIPYRLITDFQLQSIDTTGGNETFTYTAAGSYPILDAPGGNQVGSGQGTVSDFTVAILGRTGLFETGTFDLVINSYTSDGVVSPSGDHVQGMLNPGLASGGTVTFTGPVTVGGVPGLLADTSFDINGQGRINGGPLIILPPQHGTSSPLPPSAVPEPATAALVIPGLLALLGVRRRRGS